MNGSSEFIRRQQRRLLFKKKEMISSEIQHHEGQISRSVMHHFFGSTLLDRTKTHLVLGR